METHREKVDVQGQAAEGLLAGRVFLCSDENVMVTCSKNTLKIQGIHFTRAVWSGVILREGEGVTFTAQVPGRSWRFCQRAAMTGHIEPTWSRHRAALCAQTVSHHRPPCILACVYHYSHKYKSRAEYQCFFYDMAPNTGQPLHLELSNKNNDSHRTFPRSFPSKGNMCSLCLMS